MSENGCISCRRSLLTDKENPKDQRSCQVCAGSVCKKCIEVLPALSFSFYSKIPEVLTHTYYCPACFDTNVVTAQQHYSELMEKAKGVYFFFVTQKKAIPLIRQSKVLVKVASCEDRDETILRLAFFAVEQGHNSIIYAEVVSKKIRDEGYQKTDWSGFGYPATVNAEKLERSFC